VAGIELHKLRKEFTGGQVALASLDLTIADGERLALVGPSGSGKSTVLRLIAGLEDPTSGRIVVGGRDVTDLPPERRDLTMVFQSYALYPHMTVRANLGFGLRMRGAGRDEIRSQVETAADALGISELLDRLPSQLSGGQRQRVALGRAIVRQPQAFLFDEPLSNLDPRLRGDVRAELVRLHERLRATMIYVTHDQEEAMTLGQRIAVLRAGTLEQLGSPEEIYARPANTFVATFIGSPAMNLIPAAALPRETLPRTRPAGGEFTVGIRPHDLEMTTTDAGPLRGRVDVVEPLGHARIVHVAAGDGLRLTAVVASDAPVAPGDAVGLRPRGDRLHLFNAAGTRLSDV
jgi:ABC-type sugar transport system ATPase subunit